eukprot:1664561-Lingulodinium_polyedra.AAC.1
MPPPQSAPGNGPGSWAHGGSDSDSSVGDPLPAVLQARRDAHSDSGSGSDSDWLDGGSPGRGPCSALQVGLGMDAPRHEGAAGGQHGV